MDNTLSLTRYGIPEGATELSAPITAVTITEDQADICRDWKLSWSPGPASIFIHPVTPYLVDGTLWAELAAEKIEERPVIGSTRCIRWLVPLEQNLSAREKVVQEKAREFYRIIEELSRDQERQRTLYTGIRAALNPTIKSIVEDVVFRGALPALYEETMKSIFTGMSDYFSQDFALQKKADFLDRELTELQQEWILQVTRSSITTRMAGILVTFEAPSSGQGTLRCGYQVPCAQWRPQHEAHLRTEEKASFTTHGIVWQNTGEDWKEVTLTLSTAKPSLGLDAVIPDEDILQLREKTREERKQIKVEARDQVIQSTGIGAPGPEEPPLPSDGGEIQLYRVPEKVDVVSDGNPVMIKLESFTMDASTALTATPELDSHVFLISEVKNSRNRPILAGPATLLRGGNYAGQGTVDFVAPGEDFHLWWGSEDLLRVERFADEKVDDATLLQNRKVTRTITLHVRNLSGEESGFTVKERIPVSELEQVRIKMKKAPEKGTEPDKNGFILIDVTLGPREEKRIDYSYTIETDKDVNHGAL
jgi:uncharacterized protein (TIGR02231 family)